MLFVDLDGCHVPALGLGTWKMKGTECRKVVQDALAMGYRRVDTAQLYDNEADVGGALRDSGVDRDALWITTKVAPDNLAHDDVLRSSRESLKRLALDHVDLLLIHWPSQEVSLEETLAAMGTLQEKGLTRRVGVSNFPPRLLEEARRLHPVFSIQVEYHPYLAQEKLVQYARAFDLMLTAYCPLARGRAPRDRTMEQIGQRYGKTAAQVALRWLVQQRNVSAIPKAADATHLRQNLDIFDFELSPAEMDRIFALHRGQRLIEPDNAPNWNQL